MAAADDEHRRDAGWILGEALRLADEIWENEDRHVEHRPGYDVDVTVNAAVELAGAVKALDGLLENGYPLPHSWRKLESAVVDGEAHDFQLSGWRLVAWRLIRVSAVANLLGRFEGRVLGTGGRLGKLTRPWTWKQR
ncbi:MAG: hypothetical protein ACRD0C_05980 [Acidimicrobiia bacterium]